MTSAKHVALLSRMQAARRQTQHQLDLIDRKIRRRMLLLVPPFGRRQRRPYGDKARQTGTSLERFRADLAALWRSGSMNSARSPESLPGRMLQLRGWWRGRTPNRTVSVIGLLHRTRQGEICGGCAISFHRPE